MRLLSATGAWLGSSLVVATAAALVLLARARVVILVYHDDRAVIQLRVILAVLDRAAPLSSHFVSHRWACHVLCHSRFCPIAWVPACRLRCLFALLSLGGALLQGVVPDVALWIDFQREGLGGVRPDQSFMARSVLLQYIGA